MGAELSLPMHPSPTYSDRPGVCGAAVGGGVGWRLANTLTTRS